MPPTAPPHPSFWPDIPNVRVWKALELLLAARTAARFANRTAWDFAVEALELRSEGLTTTDLRWLVSMGYAQHAQEQMHLGSSCRSFRPISNLAFPRNTCFVVTEKGERLAALGTYRISSSDSIVAKCSADTLMSETGIPRWDGVLRQLWWRGFVVKEFRLPARNQETILAVLEEEGWPPHIDDPLSPLDGLDSKARLHDAIKNLNRNQFTRLLRFRGDGSGQGVVWSPLIRPEPSPELP
jgi:hypothetical protein